MEIERREKFQNKEFVNNKNSGGNASKIKAEKCLSDLNIMSQVTSKRAVSKKG